MKYEFRKLDKATINRLIELSKKWVDEDCSYVSVKNKTDSI